MSFKRITKRDGRKMKFDENKIVNTIHKAAQAVDEDFNEEISKKLADEVVLDLETNCTKKNPTVEDIQDSVEKILIKEDYAEIAKAFILYRADRTRIREMNTKLMKTYEDLTFKDAAENDVKRENANINGDTAMGTMLKYGSEGAKSFYEMYVLDPKHSKAHKEGDIHIHDLDFLTLTTTCCQIDLRKLFKNGFSTGHGFLREPNDIASYAALACIAIQSNQNDQHGGQSVPYFDYCMTDGVKKSFRKLYWKNIGKIIDLSLDKTDSEQLIKNFVETELEKYELYPCMANDNDYLEKEAEFLRTFIAEENVEKMQEKAMAYTHNEIRRATYQAMEAFIHNLNTMHSRAGAQVPFSSINYGTDTSPEGRLVTQCLLEATNAGLGKGETAIFPIHIFKVKEGINYNPEDPNYDLFKLACKVSAKRLFPNFSFIDAPFNLQYYKEGKPETEIAYMGCRTRVIGNVYDPSREIVSGRGNLSFTTINLPRLGIEAKGDINKFFRLLDEKIDLCIDQLNHRFKIQCQKKVKNYPFLMGQGVWMDSEELWNEASVEEVLKHGTLSVGFIGLAETLIALIGKHHGESDEAQELGLKIIGHMRKRMDNESEKTGLNYSLLATPAEGLSGRFVKIDQKKYGELENITSREYYTNSFHVPVYYNISAYDKIRLEAPYHELTNAGHISYVELDGDPLKNLDAFESVIRCMKESGIGYGSINHPIDRDSVCGYTGIIDNECPNCGRLEDEGPNFERIRRITGYLVGTVDRFNNAKKAEVHDRVKHGVGNGEFEQL